MKMGKRWRKIICLALVLMMFTVEIPDSTIILSAAETEQVNAGKYRTGENNTYGKTLKQAETDEEINNIEKSETEDSDKTNEKQQKTTGAGNNIEDKAEDQTASEDEAEDETKLEDGAQEECGEETETENQEESSTEDLEEPDIQAAQRAATETISKLKERFPAGKYWNRVSLSYNNPDGVTRTPCPANHNTEPNTCNDFKGYAQCWGFAYRLAYGYYGSCPATGGWSQSTDPSSLDSLKPGDIVRFKSGNYGHSIWVIGVDGDKVTFADCNGDYHCGIRWGGDAVTYKSTLRQILIHKWSAPYAATDDEPPVPPEPNRLTPAKDFYAYIRFSKNGAYVENVNGNVKLSQKPDFTYYNPNQIWHFVQGGDGQYYNIYSEANGQCMDVLNGGGAGTNVQTWYYNNDTPQKWYIYDAGGGKCFLSPLHNTELALDVPNGETAAGTNIQVYTRWDGDPQWFCLDIIEDYTRPITGYGDDFYAYIEYNNSGAYVENRENVKNGVAINNVQISAPAEFALQPSYEPRQIWHFIKQYDGVYKDTYKIVNEYDGRCLDAEGMGTVKGTNIIVWESNDSGTQRWYITPGGESRLEDPLFNLMPVYCFRQSLVMDVESASKETGTNVSLWTRNSSPAQTFNIYKLGNFSENSLKNYKKPDKPSAPASIDVSGSKGNTSISWSPVMRAGSFDSRKYELKIYIGSDANGTLIVDELLEDNTYMCDFLDNGTYTVQVRAVNTKYEAYYSDAVTESFTIKDAIELRFGNMESPDMKQGKIEVAAANNENDAHNVNLIAATYSTSGKMLGCVTLPHVLESGENRIYISIPAFNSGNLVKVFCLDRETLAPLADCISYYGNALSSEWVLAADAPADAVILEEKWTYTYTETDTTTSELPSLDGWEQTGYSLQETGNGTYYYADYPSGFNTGHTLYNTYNKSGLAASESETTRRSVTSSVKDYIYYHWTYNMSRLPNENYNVLVEDHYCFNAAGTREYYNFRAFESGTAYGNYDPNGVNGEECFYAWLGNPEDGSWWWFRFPVYKQSYTDYKKIFNYEKKTVTERESAVAVSESDAVSNVRHWVRYQLKK